MQSVAAGSRLCTSAHTGAISMLPNRCCQSAHSQRLVCEPGVRHQRRCYCGCSAEATTGVAGVKGAAERVSLQRDVDNNGKSQGLYRLSDWTISDPSLAAFGRQNKRRYISGYGTMCNCMV
ncbi:hypothetical protein ABBQ38_001885 [Trebouxia sp. C0009 RCD-2024]